MKPKILFIIYFLILGFIAFGQKDKVSKFSNVSIDKFGNIKWTISYFQKDYRSEIIVQQLKNEKWVDIGGYGSNTIAVDKPLEPSTDLITENGSSQVKFHKGINKYRIRMTFPEKLASDEIQLISEVSNDDGSLWIMDNVIYLDKVEQYEILSNVGSAILKGESEKIDISSLPQGSYFFYTKKFTKPFVK